MQSAKARQETVGHLDQLHSEAVTASEEPKAEVASGSAFQAAGSGRL